MYIYIPNMYIYQKFKQSILIYQKFHDMNGFVKLRAVSNLSTFSA